MRKMKFSKKKFKFVFSAIVISIALAYSIVTLCVRIYAIVIDRKSNAGEVQAQTSEAAVGTDINELTNGAAQDEIVEPEPEEYATSHMDADGQQQDPLSTSPIVLSDVYAEEDSIVVFKSYYPKASGYVWETYDAEAGNWITAPNDAVIVGTDELYRPVSSFIVAASEEYEDLSVRCRVELDSGESHIDMAALHILPEISNISVEEYTAGAGTYVSAKEIPVLVSFQNGSQDTVIGLNGLYFLEKEESSERDTTVSGNITETITTVLTACDYCYLNGEKESILRYQGSGDPVDILIKLIGQDIKPPEIENLSISDFEISVVDQPVPVTVTITAEDDMTAYPDLEYAFLPEGEEPQEKDWIKQASFNADLTKNGAWTAYCRDESGNIATEVKDIIAVDNKAPGVNLSLENDTWCTENKILVNARDSLSMEYCYSCAETGEDSGWNARDEYTVTRNGTWQVKVRDAVGNVTEQEITVENIDKQAPVIIQITEKQK